MLVTISSLLLLGASAADDHPSDKVERIPGLPISRACDQAMECRRHVFQSNEDAKCFGTYGCLGAEFYTTNTIKCAGLGACYHAVFSGDSPKVICTGFKACERAQGMSKTGGATTGSAAISTDDMICDGFQACSAINGGVFGSNRVVCDGDLVCSNKKNDKGSTDFDVVSDNLVVCNGRAACYGSKLTAASEIYCDGDAACRETRTYTPVLKCEGSRSCGGSTAVHSVTEAYLYGDRAAALSQIQIADGAKSLYIEAKGFIAFKTGSVFPRGAALTVEAYGWKSMKSAYIQCGGGSECTVTCKGNACKDMLIDVDKISSINVTPEGCDPCSADYLASKKDPNLPAKQKGVHCPLITYAADLKRACAAPERNEAVLAYYAEAKKIAVAELDELENLADEELFDNLEAIHDDLESVIEEQVFEEQDIIDFDLKVPKEAEGIVIEKACDQTVECARKTFGTNKRAACFGYFGCYGAKFETTKKVVCSGSAACQQSKFSGHAEGVVCNGWKSCNDIKGRGIIGKEKVLCNGAFTCNNLVSIEADTFIACDGDAACTNNARDPEAVPELKLFSSHVRCAGKNACIQNRIDAEDLAECDGDGACRKAKILSDAVECHGKRVCQNADVSATELNLFGFFSGASTTISPRVSGGRLTINANGFNSLVKSEIKAQKGELTLNANGYRAMVDATLWCGSATCNINCNYIACKGLTVYYDKNSVINMDPPSCKPGDDFIASKKDPNKGAKVAGNFCPTFEVTERLQAHDAEMTKELEEFSIENEKEIQDALQRHIDAHEGQQIPAELSTFNDEEQEMHVAMNTVSSFQSSGKTLVASNLITALCVFVACAVAAFVYAVYKNKKTGEFKPLLN